MTEHGAPLAGLPAAVMAPPSGCETPGPHTAPDPAEIARSVRERFGGFILEHINPEASARDAVNAPLPREILREAARLGLTGMALPRDVGGEGRDLYTWGLVIEEVAYLSDDLSFPLLISLFSAVASTINDSGRDELVARYVEPVVRGDRFVSFAFSEERDAFSFLSTAAKDGDCYVLNGRKVIVTGGLLADAYMTYLRNDRGDLVTVLVERDDPGLEVTPVHTMGVRAAGLARLRFHDVRVPADRILAARDGLAHVQRFLNQRRLLLSCGAVGRMRWAVDSCVQLLSGTERYRMALTDMQAVQAKLGRIFISLETSRIVAHDGLRRLAAGDYDPIWDPHLSAAKHYLTEQAIDIGHAILHLTGGRGYESKYGFERYVRDVAGLIAGSGAQDILEIDLGVWLVSQWQRDRAVEERP
jgi:alkylation response protein AidB-like acyl-CoA dehydrogenase